MNKHNQTESIDIDESFEPINRVYQKHSTELPDITLDRQIIAAAHREIAHPNARKTPENGWLRRFGLPIYAATTFAFTALATHFYWPAPVKMLPGTSPGPVKFEVRETQVEVPQKTTRKPLETPEPTMLLPIPDSRNSGLQGVNDEKSLYFQPQHEQITDIEHQKTSDSAELVQAHTKSEQHQANLHIRDKEIWAREIFLLYKRGEFESGKTELAQFKKTYPDYPIDEQLEILRQ